MLQTRSHLEFSCSQKQVGMSAYWLAINLSNDRTPEQGVSIT